MINLVLFKVYKFNFYRNFLSFNIFLYSKIKRFLKFIYKLICIRLRKTVDIKKLVEKREVTQKLVFKGEVYILPEKYDIDGRKFLYVPFGKYNVPDYHIYILDNGLIKAGTNCIFSKNGRNITGLNFQEMPFDFKIISNLKNIDIFFIDSTVLVLGLGAIENNYGHAWTELAARAYAVKISKINFEYLLIDYKNKFTFEIIKLLNLSDKKIIISSEHKYIQAKQLIYPELINNFKEYFLNGLYLYHRKYLPYWIKYLYQDVSDKLLSSNFVGCFEKIYISRRNKNIRNIINEKELIITLKNLGFEIIHFEDYSVSDQIKITQSSNYIISLHGAGMINCNFCREGTKILELFPFYYQCGFAYMNANMFKLDYDYYIGDPVNKLWQERPIMESFNVNIEVIRKFLKAKWNI